MKRSSCHGDPIITKSIVCSKSTRDLFVIHVAAGTRMSGGAEQLSKLNLGQSLVNQVLEHELDILLLTRSWHNHFETQKS